MSLPTTVTINNTVYPTAELSEAARSHLLDVRAVDAEIARVQQSLAICQTARRAYVGALIKSVEENAVKPVKPARAVKPGAEKAAKPRARKS